MAEKKKQEDSFVKVKNVFASGVSGKKISERGDKKTCKSKKKRQNHNGYDSKQENQKFQDYVAGDTEKSDFIKETNAFTGTERKAQESQQDDDVLPHRDTYHQSEKKKKYLRHKTERNSSSKSSNFTSDFRPEDTSFKEDKDFTRGEDAETPFLGDRKLGRLQKKSKKAQVKAMRAREKLSGKKKYTFGRVFDEKRGKAKYVLTAVKKEKPIQSGGFGRRATSQFSAEYAHFVHGKIAEVEGENSAVEGAHKSEQKAEDVYRFMKNHRKNKMRKRQKKAAKLEKKYFQKEINFQYQKFLEENPQIQKKAFRKRFQKQRIKRDYIKARKKAVAFRTAEQAFERTKNGTVIVARKLQEFARKRISLFVVMGIMALLLMTIMVSVSSCGAIFTDMQSTILAASYLSKPKEIDAADLQFTRLELDLQEQIDRVEMDYPEYDEYSYNLGEIRHDPYTLISYLSAIHTEFTANEVESEIQALFNEMYTLTLTPDTETRTKTVTDPDTGRETEEEYEVSILRVTLTAIPLENLVAEKMNTEQAEIFAMYRETNGLLQEFSFPLNIYWYNYISSYYGYRKNPSTGNEEFHRGVDIAVPAGTAVYAAHDGTITEAAYDSHYGNYVVIEIDGYTTKYAHMDGINVSVGQKVSKGVVIGRTGNTGSSTGSHLHIECLYDGEYYNPLFYFEAGEGALPGETPGNPPGNTIPPNAYDDESVQALMEEAVKYLGFPYVWGGSNPSTSFDCSGFVCWTFTNSGVHNLPRTTAQGIYDQCTPVSASDAKAGDIIFFTGTYNSGVPVSHVGIYCGNGTMIHCGDPISYANINSSYWQSHFYSFGRLN